jgi:hypothetical protein
MRKYKDWSPTQFDPKGYILDERKHWSVFPCSQTRDSNCFERANFDSAIELLGGESDNVEIHRFGHWGPGWFEIIIIKPNTREHSIAEKLVEKLEDYPCLDDDRYSMYEYEEMQENWIHSSLQERIDILKEKGICYLQARKEEVPNGLYPEDLGVY